MKLAELIREYRHSLDRGGDSPELRERLIEERDQRRKEYFNLRWNKSVDDYKYVLVNEITAIENALNW